MADACDYDISKADAVFNVPCGGSVRYQVRDVTKGIR